MGDRAGGLVLGVDVVVAGGAAHRTQDWADFVELAREEVEREVR